jgi:hypothetical protein
MKRTAMRAERRRLSLFCLTSWGFATGFRRAKAIDEIQVYNAPRRYWFRQSGQADFAPAVRLARKLDRDLFVGLEYYADFGEIGRFGKLSDQQHTLFAVTDFKLGVFDCNLGVGYGLTPSSDRLVVKTIIGYAFPAPGGSPDASEPTPTGPVNPMSRCCPPSSYQ